MRFRRVEFVAIALAFAFVCFMGGYFMGSRGTVSIVSASSQNGAEQTVGGVEAATYSPANISSEPVPPSTNNAASSNDSSNESASTRTSEEGGLGKTASEPSVETEPADMPEVSSPASVQEGGGDALGAPRGGDGRININTASQAELMDLPGVGSVISERIIDYRNQYGAFSRIEDIMKVSGIGEKKFESIKDKITV